MKKRGSLVIVWIYSFENGLLEILFQSSSTELDSETHISTIYSQ